jgi:AraC-like DNA-binding protein
VRFYALHSCSRSAPSPQITGIDSGENDRLAGLLDCLSAFMGARMRDPLSDVLRSVRLTGGVFLAARFTAPWCISAKIDAEDCKPFLDVPAQIICYHVVTEGTLLVTLEDETSIEVRAGEVILLPRNDWHLMASAAGIEPVSASTLIQPPSGGGLPSIVHGGGGEPTNLICGFLGSADVFNPLLEALPAVLTLDIRQGMARDWIETSVRFAASELAAGRLASSSVLSRLSELLLIEAVRQYSVSVADGEAGWLKGLVDPQIGRALALIHEDLGAPLSVEELAREAALSRSAFTDRFTSVVGTPPIRYMTVWRLAAAKRQLAESARGVGQIAHSVGYQSEAAFSRAFKREFGVPPVRWRDQAGESAIIDVRQPA